MFLGSGTFGTVYTRIPFEDELFEQVKDKREASKIFRCEGTYTDSSLVLSRLNMKLSYSQIEELHKYVLLPIRCGKINTTQHLPFIKHEDSPLVSKRCSIFGSKYAIFSNMEIKYVTHQITYPLGKPVTEEYDNVFELGYTLDTIYSQLQYLLEGLHLLHSHDFVHTDIKLANIVDIDGKWKYADSGDIYNVRDRSTAFEDRSYNLAVQYTFGHYSPYVYWLMSKKSLSMYIQYMDMGFIAFKDTVYGRIENMLVKKNKLELNDEEWLEFAETFYKIKNYACCGVLNTREQKMSNMPNDTMKYLNMLGVNEFYYSPKPDKYDILKVNDMYSFGFMIWCIIDTYIGFGSLERKDIQVDVLRSMVNMAIRYTLPVV
jgi:serine/threonine protein kinase